MIAEDDEARPDIPENDDAPPPATPEEWRTLLARLPARDLLRLVQEDQNRARRLLAGFRPAPDLIRNAVVVSRVVEEATKQPKFGRELVELSASQVARSIATPEAGAPVKTESVPSQPSDAAIPANVPAVIEMDTVSTTPETGSQRLREKLREQRVLLVERERRIAALEDSLSQAEREREIALTSAENARAAQRAAEALEERQRRQHDRLQRRREKSNTPVASGRGSAEEETSRAAVSLLSAAPPVAMAAPPYEEALRRLLQRGRQDRVAEVCREALLDADTAMKAAPVHALYAECLYALGEEDRAIEQDRLAVTAFLDSGRTNLAAESLFRLLVNRATNASITVSRSDVLLLRRLLLLSERMGEITAVRNRFQQMRFTAPAAFASLRKALAQTEKRFLSLLEVEARTYPLTPDTPIALPTAHTPAATVSARDLVRAVQGNEVFYVFRVREALGALQEIDRALSDALLEAVALLNPAMVIPYSSSNLPRPIIVDASNVARHEADPLAFAPPPRTQNLLKMRDYLLQKGYFPILMIADANLRFKVDDRVLYLEMVQSGVIRETLPGTSADTILIREAHERDAPLVTNDRLSDWGEAAQGIAIIRFGFFPGGNGVSLTSF